MSRLRSLLLIATVVFGTAAVGVGSVTGAGTGVVTIDTTTTPERPSPGESVTISTTISNPDAGTETYSLRKVSVQESERDNSTVYDTANHDASISAGESVTRDLSVDIEDSGTHTYVLHIQLLAGGEVINLERTVTVTTGQTDPALSLSAGSVGPSGETTFDLSVSNARIEAIRALTVDLTADGVSFDENRRVVSQLGPGSEATLQYPATNVTAGQKSVTANVEYTTSDGEYRSTTRELTATVDRVANPGEVSLSGVTVANTGGELTVSGKVNNVGETPVSSVRVGAAGNVSLGDAQSSTFAGALAPDGSKPFELVTVVPAAGERATIPLDIRYRVDGERTTRSLTVAYEPGTDSDIALTDVAVQQVGDQLTIRGSASNLGQSSASSVVVSVVDGEAVAPAESGASHFAGTLDESGATPFEVAARLAADTNQTVSIPLQVQYQVDGERVTRTMTVAHEPSSDSDIEITGVRVEQAGGRLTIRGSTSNVGTTNASSLVVTVADGARVGPAESESSYFVGAVQQSDFKSFQVDARLTAESNQTISIPLDVRYQVDGQQVAETITVSYTPRTTTQASQSQRDSSVPVALVGGVALLVLVGGFAYRRYR